MPTVSVILPVYNGQDYLKYAIDSILSQTFRDFELLIIDDGSKDQSLQIIQSYSDPRIRLISQDNIGLTKTLNRLIYEARGPLLARMDQDDWSHPERLRLQVEFFQSHSGVKMCGSWIKAIDTKNCEVYQHKYPVTNHAIHEEMLLSNPFAHGSVMIRKMDDVFYRTEYNNAEDIDHWARQCMQFTVANIPDFLYHWRVNPKGITLTQSIILTHSDSLFAVAKKVREEYKTWYLKNTTASLPSLSEMRQERKLTGFRSLYTRKRALMQLFRQANRLDLVRREWRYLQRTLF